MRKLFTLCFLLITSVLIAQDCSLEITNFIGASIDVDQTSSTSTITANGTYFVFKEETLTFTNNSASVVSFDVETCTGYTEAISLNVGEQTMISSANLPVEWLYFKKEVKGSKVVLEWGTATELDNGHFEVEQSKNGQQFDKIGTVQGAGTTAEQSDYAFLDRLRKGITYYRIKQVDFDGTFNYSATIAVENEGIALPFFSNQIKTIQELPPNILDNISVIYASNGQRVTDCTSKGIYFIKLNDGQLIKILSN